MSIKRLKKQLRRSLFWGIPFLCLLAFILFVKILTFLHTSKNQFDPVSYTLQNAVPLEGHELSRYNAAALENKLIAVTGRLYADNTLNEPMSLSSKQFVVLERQEKRYERKSKGVKQWRFKKYHFDFCNAATLDGYSFSLPNIINFFNMPSDVDNKPPIYISADPQNSLSSPEVGDILYTFTRGIRSSSKITLLCTFSNNRFIPYELKTMYGEVYQAYTFFYMSVGAFDDLIKGLSQKHENNLKNDQVLACLCLYFILAIPYWLLFRRWWPASPEPSYNPNDRYYFRRRRGLSFRNLVFLATLGIITFLILQICLELIKLF